MIECEQRNSKHWELTPEGCQVAEKGSHEAVIFNYLATHPKGIPKDELTVGQWIALFPV